MTPRLLRFLLLASFAVAPLQAEWTALPGNETATVAKTLDVVPKSEWNKSSARPSPRGESWTRDGLALNELTFFGGIVDGESLYREQIFANKPLPKFRSEMLATDLVELFESSNRILLQSSVFAVDTVEPARLGAHDGVRFGYSYAAQNDGLTRRGEGVAAIVDGRLYLINFVAPAIHYFDRDINEIRQIVETAKLRPPKSASSK